MSFPLDSVVAEAVRDGVAPVAAKILATNFDARRSLATLVFGDVEQVLNSADGLLIMATREQFVDISFLIHKAAQDIV